MNNKELTFKFEIQQDNTIYGWTLVFTHEQCANLIYPGLIMDQVMDNISNTLTYVFDTEESVIRVDKDIIFSLTGSHHSGEPFEHYYLLTREELQDISFDNVVNPEEINEPIVFIKKLPNPDIVADTIHDYVIDEFNLKVLEEMSFIKNGLRVRVNEPNVENGGDDAYFRSGWTTEERLVSRIKNEINVYLPPPDDNLIQLFERFNAQCILNKAKKRITSS